MTFWDFLARLVPGERGWVIILLAALIAALLALAYADPSLWSVELFKLLLQGLIITGLLNMVIAFHFTANAGDEQKTRNTGEAFKAITAVTEAGERAKDDAERNDKEA